MNRKIATLVLIISTIFIASIAIPVIILIQSNKEMPMPSKCPLGHTIFTKEKVKRSYFGTGKLRIWLINTFDPPETYYICTECGYRMYECGMRWRHSNDPSSFSPAFPDFAILDIKGAEIGYTRELLFDKIAKDTVSIKNLDPKIAKKRILDAFRANVIDDFYRLSEGWDVFLETEHENHKVLLKLQQGHSVYIEITYSEKAEEPKELP